MVADRIETFDTVARQHGWTRPRRGLNFLTWERGSERLAVRLGRSQRVLAAQHFTAGRWVSMTGLNKAERVLNILTTD